LFEVRWYREKPGSTDPHSLRSSKSTPRVLSTFVSILPRRQKVFFSIFPSHKKNIEGKTYPAMESPVCGKADSAISVSAKNHIHKL